VTGHPPSRGPNSESDETCMHCMQAPDRQSRQHRATGRTAKYKVGIVGTPGLVPWRGKGRSGTEEGGLPGACDSKD